MIDPALTWVEAALGGDEAAAARLIGEFQARIYAFLRRLAGSDSDAVELTQRTFCRVWNALGSFEARSTVSSWMHGIAYRTYVDWRRSGGRFDDRGEEWWLAQRDGAPTPDVVASVSDTASVVYGLVDGLDAGLRDAVHLHYYQGLTLQETAEVLGIAVSTVKFRVREALRQLQRRLADPGFVVRPAPVKRG